MEVVVMTEDEQEGVEEAVIGETVSPAGLTSNQSSAAGGEECLVPPVVLDVDR